MQRHGPETIIPLAIALVLSALFLFGALDSLVARRGAEQEPGTIAVGEVMSLDLEGYARVDGPRELVFPIDHGPHPDHRTEWWYFTGNVTTESGRAFGYQLTFFRTALAPPPADREARASAWATRQLFMGHFAVSDVEAERFHAFERFSRGALGLAGAEAPPLRVWLEDWELEPTDAQAFPVRLHASQDGVEIDLELRPEKALVLHGDRGYSVKNAAGDVASYYVSYTRLATIGQIRLEGQVFEVAGSSWFDHEFGSGALDRSQSGWDWFSIQLDDGRDLMFAQVRDRSGGAPFRVAALVDRDGTSRELDVAEIAFREQASWTSPASGAHYPSAWSLEIPEIELALEILPAMANQELPLAIRYWEGSTRIRGLSRGRPVSGVGYAELTGYVDGPR